MNGRYNVKIYRADGSVKSGRKLANTNQNGGTDLVAALRKIADGIEKQGENSTRIVRVLVDQELPETETDSDFGLSLADETPAAAETTGENTPATDAPAPDAPKPQTRKR